MRSADFFDVENYPHIKVKTKRMEAAGENRYKVTADVTIKDVTREIVPDITTESLDKDPWGNLRQDFSAELPLIVKILALTGM